jgi:hypothetical protein
LRIGFSHLWRIFFSERSSRSTTPATAPFRASFWNGYRWKRTRMILFSNNQILVQVIAIGCAIGEVTLPGALFAGGFVDQFPPKPALRLGLYCNRLSVPPRPLGISSSYRLMSGYVERWLLQEIPTPSRPRVEVEASTSHGQSRPLQSSSARRQSTTTTTGRRTAFGKKFRVSATMECKHAAMLRGQNIVDQSGQCSLPFASEPPRRSPNYVLVYQRNL